MKNFLFLIFVFCSSLGIGSMIGCGSKASSGRPSNKQDSVWTTVTYEFDWQKNDYRMSTARRVIKDSLQTTYDTLEGGKVVGEPKWVKDTSYYVPIQAPLKDSAGNLLKTTSGTDSTTTIWPLLPRSKLLHDYNKSYQQ